MGVAGVRHFLWVFTDLVDTRNLIPHHENPYVKQ